ncbi:MAG: phosphoribosylamine--glycine ligase [Dehalococcoidia bacterium]
MTGMSVVLLGSGGREHAIAWKLAQSSMLAKLWIAPGNAGTADFGENVDVRATDVEGVVRLAQRVRADLVIVAPDDPLAAGVVDALAAAGIAAFGPTRAAAELEWSKSFAKQVMREAGIPTAESRVFEDAGEARLYVEGLGGPCVVKADGLALGKGVTVCDDVSQALAAIDEMMVRRAFGDAGARVVIEERMRGPETSAHAFSDGVTVRHMPFSCDHKPAFDGNLGPNTGGMGVYSPPGWLSAEHASFIEREVTEAAVRAMAGAGRPYRGVLYPGMMVTDSGPRVVEFNCRFGDPETEALLPRLRSDLLAICDAVAHGRLADVPVEWSEAATVGVVLASGGYPGAYETGFPIEGVGDVDADVQVFLAGAKRDDAGVLRTSGGRVLCVVASGATVAEARARAYDNVRRIHFEGMHYRTDIGVTADAPIGSRP